MMNSSPLEVLAAVSSQTAEGETSTLKCPQCSREFTSKRNLIDHCRGHHQGTKPHCCDYPGCGKSFLRPAHLAIHVRIHTGEKPFVCDYPGCDKRWNQKSALKQHKRSHTGEKPYHCTIKGCSKRFSTSSSCKRHIGTHYIKHRLSSSKLDLVDGGRDLDVVSGSSSGGSSESEYYDGTPTLSPIGSEGGGLSSLPSVQDLMEYASSAASRRNSTNSSPVSSPKSEFVFPAVSQVAQLLVVPPLRMPKSKTSASPNCARFASKENTLDRPKMNLTYILN